MNINTLNAAKAEHKSNEVPFALYKNNFRSGKGSAYFARIINQGTCTDEDLACDIIAAGLASGLTKETLLEVAALFRNAKIARLLTDCTVDDGVTKCALGLSGTFISQNDPYSPERHSVTLKCNTSPKMKPIIKEVTPTLRQGNTILPTITEVHDLESGGSDTLTRSGFLEVKGANLTIAGENEDVGLYFVSTEDESKTVRLGADKIGRNNPSSLCCVVPSELVAGTYKIMIRTQHLSGKTLAKDTREYVFEGEFQLA